jgi:hypothetical protein
MLSASPKVLSALPVDVSSESNALVRWFVFLKARGELRRDRPVYEVMDDGTRFAIDTGAIDSLADASERACVDCAATEFRRDG